MRKVLKVSSLVILVLLVLAAAAVAVLVQKPEVYVSAVDRLLHDRTGYRITIQDIEVNLSPARLTVTGLALRNPDWPDRPLLLEAQSTRLQVDPWRAARGQEPYWSLQTGGLVANLEQNDEGDWNWQTTVQREEDDAPFQVGFDRINVERGELHYRRPEATRTLAIDRLEARRRGPRALSVQGSGTYQAEPVEIDGRVSLPGARSRTAELALRASGAGLDIDANGELHRDAFADSRLNVTVRSGQLDTLEQLLATSLPDVAPLNVSLELQGQDAQTLAVTLDGDTQQRPVSISGTITRAAPGADSRLLQVDLEGGALGVSATAEGLVNLSDPGRKTDARINVGAERLQAVEKMLQADLPALAPLDLSMHLRGVDGAYEIASLELHAADASVSGSGRYDPAAREAVIELATDAIRLAPFQEQGAAGQEPDGASDEGRSPPPAAQAESPLDWRWLRLGRATVDLSVGELSSRDFLFRDLDAHMEVRDGKLELAPVATRVAIPADNGDGEPAFTDRLSLTGTITPLGARTEGRDARLDLAISGGDINVSVSGEANLNGFDQQSLELNAGTPGLDTLATLLGSDIRFLAPAEVHARIVGGRDNVRFEPLSIVLQESDASGQYHVDWSGPRVRINGEISSNNFDVDGFTPVDPEDQGEDADSGGPVFSEQPFALDWMDSFAVDLAARFGRMTVNTTTFRNVEVTAVLDPDGLAVEPVRGDLTEGGVRGRLSLVKGSGGVELQTRFSVVNLTPADLGRPGEGFLDGGHTDLDVDITGRGASPRELAASLDGELTAEIQESTIRNDMLDLIGSDLLTQLVTAIVPFVKNDDVTRLQCAALHFTAKDGVLTSDKRLIVETKKMKVIGGGVINLNNEKLEIGFSPKARSGIGVSVGTIAKFVRLGGTLSNPRPETDPQGLLESGATIGAAAATGGISLLVQGLMDRAASEGTACGNIFRREADVPEAIQTGTEREDGGNGAREEDGQEETGQDAGSQAGDGDDDAPDRVGEPPIGGR